VAEDESTGFGVSTSRTVGRFALTNIRREAISDKLFHRIISPLYDPVASKFGGENASDSMSSVCSYNK